MAKLRISTLDAFVGERIRERRCRLGLTQRQFGEKVGVTNKQVHKYERGINSVSAGRLYTIARVLDAPITYFYEGFAQGAPCSYPPRQRMVFGLLRFLGEISNEEHLKALSQVTRALADCGVEPTPPQRSIRRPARGTSNPRRSSSPATGRANTEPLTSVLK